MGKRVGAMSTSRRLQNVPSAAEAKQCHVIGRDALFRKRAHNGVALMFKQPILQNKARVGNRT